jgi:hypothetical protein
VSICGLDVTLSITTIIVRSATCELSDAPGTAHAIKAKAKAVARTTSRGVSDVMHHYALSRLLARVFRAGPDRWVLKGGQAMLVRYPDARHSRDVDLVYSDHNPDYAEALAALRAAAQLDAGDQMTFEYVGCTEVANHRSGITATFKAIIGATEDLRHDRASPWQ